MERHVLAVLPHPDDETFGCGGTIHMHARAGTPVTLACGTLGEMGRNMGKPFFATRETLPDLRERELRAACAILGIGDLRLLGLRDKTIEFEDREELADRLLGIIREVRPSLIITHYPGHGVHPDHNALGAATVRAAARLAAPDRPAVHCHAVTRGREAALGPADVVEDIRDVWEVKLAAIRAHRSQSEAMMADAEERARGDPDGYERALARFMREMFWRYRF